MSTISIGFESESSSGRHGKASEAGKVESGHSITESSKKVPLATGMGGGGGGSGAGRLKGPWLRRVIGVLGVVVVVLVR
jgi:hypothetical protein